MGGARAAPVASVYDRLNGEASHILTVIDRRYIVQTVTDRRYSVPGQGPSPQFHCRAGAFGQKFGTAREQRLRTCRANQPMTDEQINKIKKIVIGLLVTVVVLMILNRVSASNPDLAWLNDQFSYLLAALFADVRVPHWVLIFLLASCAGFWIGLIRKLRPSAGSEADEPVVEDYREDLLMGVTWHWDYNPSTNEIESLRCICPKCYEPATYRENSFTPLGPVTVAQCATCGDIRDLKGKEKQVLAAVRNQIQDKLRRGMFREVVKRQRAASGSARALRKALPAEGNPFGSKRAPDSERKSLE